MMPKFGNAFAQQTELLRLGNLEQNQHVMSTDAIYAAQKTRDDAGQRSRETVAQQAQGDAAQAAIDAMIGRQETGATQLPHQRQAQQDNDHGSPRSTMSYFIGNDVSFPQPPPPKSASKAQKHLGRLRRKLMRQDPITVMPQSLGLSVDPEVQRRITERQTAYEAQLMASKYASTATTNTFTTRPSVYVKEFEGGNEGMIFGNEAGAMAPTRFGGYATRGQGMVVEGGGHVSMSGLVGGTRSTSSDYTSNRAFSGVSASTLSPIAAEFVPGGLFVAVAEVKETIEERLGRLEGEVAELRAEVAELKGRTKRFSS